MFDEITASSLVKIDWNGKILDDPLGMGVNEAGFVIHSCVHKARHEINCVIHTHTRAGVAVSAMKCGLLPISQHAMMIQADVAYHDYEGIALYREEQARMAADLGKSAKAMILRNHGLLACGPTVHDAFDLMMHLERACQAQVAAMGGNAELVIPSPAVALKVAAQFARPGRKAPANAWAALLRLLDRRDPSYRE